MSVSAWHEEPIAKRHDREAFNCDDITKNEFNPPVSRGMRVGNWHGRSNKPNGLVICSEFDGVWSQLPPISHIQANNHLKLPEP